MAHLPLPPRSSIVSLSPTRHAMGEARCKVVLRSLPASLQEAGVRDVLLAGWLDRVEWLAFRPPATSAALPFARPRAYVKLKTPEDAAALVGVINSGGAAAFVDEQGARVACTAQLAPYQKVPRPRKRDPKAGTLERGEERCCCRRRHRRRQVTPPVPWPIR